MHNGISYFYIGINYEYYFNFVSYSVLALLRVEGVEVVVEGIILSLKWFYKTVKVNQYPKQK